MISRRFQQPATIAAEEAARTLYQRMMDGWNVSSGGAFAGPFAEDGDLIAFDGTHFKGGREITQSQQRLFDTHPQGNPARWPGHARRGLERVVS